MFDMRYHIASLVAVFLALALGILVGTSIVNNGVLVDQQQKLIDNINESIKEVKVQNNALNKQVDANNGFEQAVFGKLVKDKLKNKSVAIITFEKDNDRDLQAKTESWLNEAGALTTAVSVNGPALELKDQEDIDQLKKYFPGIAEKDLKKAVIKEFISELLTKKDIKVEKYLEDKGYITLSSKQNLPFAGIVILTSNGSNDAKVNELLVSVTASRLIKTVVAESRNIIPSGLSKFISNDISTVDNIDSPSGGFSAVYVLSGKKGNYGFKDQAQALVPLDNQ